MRKLSIYNFTIFENGSKGSSEIENCLLQFLYSLPDNVSYVSTFSDTRDVQNRNKNVAAAMLYAVSNIKHLKTIYEMSKLKSLLFRGRLDAFYY